MPKPGSCRTADQALPVSRLRPISVMSVMWRIYISAKLQSTEAQAWYRAQLQSEQCGCMKKRDAQMAIVPLAEASANGQYLASLDLAQAFDRVRAHKAVELLRWRGFPQCLALGVLGIWGRQKRILLWGQQEIQRVDVSIPQGDSLSPWVLNILLSTAVRVLRRQRPRATQVVYVDDRSFATPTPEGLRSLWQGWKEHSMFLGLKESRAKTQVFGRTARQRQALADNPDLQPHVQEQMVGSRSRAIH